MILTWITRRRSRSDEEQLQWRATIFKIFDRRLHRLADDFIRLKQAGRLECCCHGCLLPINMGMVQLHLLRVTVQLVARAPQQICEVIDHIPNSPYDRHMRPA